MDSRGRLKTSGHKRREDREQLLQREQEARRKAEAEAQRFEFLAEASVLLGSSLDYQATLERVARLAVPMLADYCVVDLVEGNEIRRIATAHKDPSKEDLLKKTHHRSVTTHQNPASQVWHTGKPQLLTEVTDPILKSVAVDAEHLQIMRALGPQSWMAIPLNTRERVWGSILFATSELNRRYGPDDLALGQEIARRAALAIENAHLYRTLQEESARREEAEATVRKKMTFVELLQAVAMASNEADSVEKALQTCLNHVCTATHCLIGHVYLLDPDRSDLLAPSDLWYLADPERFDVFRRVTEEMHFPFGVGLPGRVPTSGKSAWVSNILKDANFPRAKIADDIGIKSGFAFPIWVGADVVGVLEFFSPEVTEPEDALLEVMRHIGTQIGRVVERKRAEVALKRVVEELKKKTEEAEEASRSKSKLLSIASHEMRTPLNAILGYSSLLRDKQKGKQREMQDRIHENAQTLLDLINTLLNLHKIEAGKIEIYRKEVSLSEILEGVIEMLRPMAEKKGLLIEWMDAPAVPLFWSDPVKLRQIFTNLLGNAIKFTEKGTVTARVRHRPEAGKLSVEISDTGVGIPESELPHIYEPFYRVLSSEMQPEGGTGLGLPIVKQLVDILGGTIHVLSRPGVGSTFTIELDLDSI